MVTDVTVAAGAVLVEITVSVVESVEVLVTVLAEAVVVSVSTLR